ncbi:MAG: ABC transporter ATP-binding protein, partial [Elusimicrobia bacterium]|nr:ABC transporter ATP-binding protein [Elusimicrobiota bacterium]
MPSLFEARDLHYSYRHQDQEVPVLRGVDLTVPMGSF